MADRPDAPRLVPLTVDEMTEEQRALAEPLVAFRGQLLNIFATLLHNPDTTRRWLGFGTQVLLGSSLPARDRELLILRTAWNCQAVYEFGHHTEIGHEVGVTDEEIRRVVGDPDTAGWSAPDRQLLAAADELHHDSCLSDETWAALRERYTHEQLIDLVMLVGQYHLVSMALNSFGVQREAGVPGFPT